MLTKFLSDLPVADGAATTKVVSVISGGLDSTVLTYLLVEKYGAENVHALSFNYQQKQGEELNRARTTCNHLGVEHTVLDLAILGQIARSVSTNIAGSEIEMPTIKGVIGDPQPVTYVPFRNMLLNTFAFSFAESVGASFVFSGLQATDAYGYWDTTAAFVDHMNQVAGLNRKHQIKLVAPFTGLSKAQEIELAMQLPTPPLFEHTLTCYNPDDQGQSCGVCPSCSERLAAFVKNKMKDPVKYSREIKWDDLI